MNYFHKFYKKHQGSFSRLTSTDVKGNSNNLSGQLLTGRDSVYNEIDVKRDYSKKWLD